MACIYNQAHEQKITTVHDINCHMTCIFGGKNDSIISDVKIDKPIFKPKNACHMAFFSNKHTVRSFTVLASKCALEWLVQSPLTVLNLVYTLKSSTKNYKMVQSVEHTSYTTTPNLL